MPPAGAPHLKAGDFPHQQLQTQQRNTQLRRQFRFAADRVPGWSAGYCGLLPIVVPCAADRAGSQSISRKLSRIAPRMRNIGIGTKLHMFAAVEFVQSVDQSNHSGMEHIFEQHMTRQPLVNAAGNVTHLRQLLQQQPLALSVILAAGNGSISASVIRAPPRNRARGGASRNREAHGNRIYRFNAGDLRRRLVGD